MKDKGKIIGFIIVSALCCVAVKIIGTICKLFLGGGTLIMLVLMGLASIWVLKETKKWLVFPLTSLAFALIFDISSTIKFAKILNGTASFYSFFDDRLREFVAGYVDYLGEGVNIGLTAAAAVYNIADTIGMFIITMTVSLIAKYIIPKMGNNTNKNGGKENDQAHT